ncbi:MAG: hypothetical protein WCT99_03905 [Bacteroidota bacterium]|jgi:hypothetical protein
MKTKKTNSERRKFFSRLGTGAVGAGLVSLLPSILLPSAKKNEAKSVSVSINPMAVKRRTGKGDRNG